MKFTLSWLKDHLETQASLDDITYALTDLGLEVEGVDNPAAKLAAFTIGKVIQAEQHPDADKLRVCQVATDEGESQIICGAPNARTGITVVIAKPGAAVQAGAVLLALKASLANFKVPKQCVVLAELPRNAMGKVQKNLIRAEYAQLFTA